MQFSFAKDSDYSILIITFAAEIINNGALAHLARAFDWQSRGDEFESRMLHERKASRPFSFFICLRYQIIPLLWQIIPLL